MTGAKPYLLVPVYDKYDEAKQDLQDLLTSLRLGAYSDHFRVLVLLDGCHRIFAHEFSVMFPEFEFSNHTGNAKNFVANVNIGLRHAREEGVGALIVNMDSILCGSGDMVGRMVTKDFEGIRSARTMDLAPHISSLEDVLGALNRQNAEIGIKEAPISVTGIKGNKVAGYCFYVSPKCLQEIGLLPEHVLRASFDDDFYQALALLAGFSVELAPVYIRHTGSHLDQMKEGKSRTGAYSPIDGSLELHRMKFQDYWKIPSTVSSDKYIAWILQNYQWTPELRRAIICE